jgi:general secretion pathway protein D
MVMSITPQISADEQVTLNIRPTISRITDYKTDPAPRLAGANFDNLIPQIQVRELESVLKLRTGQIAVLGGLIQDTLSYKKDGLPGLGNLPVVGDAFNVRDEKKTKTELVIFLRPTVIHHPSVQKDFQEFAPYLPNTMNQRIESE